MSKQIITITSAEVPTERAEEIVPAYHPVLAQEFPDRLLPTYLVHAGQPSRAIHTLWRDRAAIDAMRAGPQPPALFRNLGAEPTLTIRTVETT